MTITEIKNGLVDSCITGNPTTFIPFLLSPIVKTEMSNKTSFYSFYKFMLKCAKTDSIEPWSLKIEKSNWRNQKYAHAYCFYDKKYFYPRFTIYFYKKNNFLYIDIMPF